MAWKAIPIPEWLALMQQKPIDPYLIWSDLTGLRQFTSQERPDITSLSFLVELDKPFVAADFPGLVVPDVYLDALDTGGASRFVTVRRVFTVDFVNWLKAFLVMPGVVRIQLGFPVAEQPAMPRSTFANLSGTVQLPGGTSSVTCAILDDGCPFAHDQFRLAGGPTRVVALWDQTPVESVAAGADPGAWAPPKRVPYGVEVTNALLDPIIARHVLADEVDEDLCYREAFGARQHGVDSARTHGAAVMDLMTGRVDYRCDVARNTPTAATCAPIVFVQFPTAQTNVSNGRWLSVNALDGLRYVIDVVENFKTSTPPGSRKIVANLSYGASAGAHDGSAMLVRAMDELCERRGNLAIVLAAGNSQAVRGHAKRTIPSKEHRTLRVIIPPDKSYETYLEIWFHDPSHAAVAQIEIVPPAGAPTRVISRGDIGTWRVSDIPPGPAQDDLVAAAIFAPDVVQSTRGGMALLVVASTQLSGRYVFAPAGEWRVEITNGGESEIKVEAWLERDDIRYEHRSQSAHFDDDPTDPEEPVYVTRDNTMSSLSGGTATIAVGAYVDSAPVDAGVGSSPAPSWPGVTAAVATIANYSGLGDVGAVQPPLYARAEAGYALGQIRVAGTRSGMTTRMSGTSIAAPQVGRALLELMGNESGSLGAQQIKRLVASIGQVDPSLLLASQVGLQGGNQGGDIVQMPPITPRTSSL